MKDGLQKGVTNIVREVLGVREAGLEQRNTMLPIAHTVWEKRVQMMTHLWTAQFGQSNTI
jgi:hypothetical protein